MSESGEITNTGYINDIIEADPKSFSESLFKLKSSGDIKKWGISCIKAKPISKREFDRQVLYKFETSLIYVNLLSFSLF